MKKIICILGVVLATTSAFAQGTIAFNNRITGQVDAPVYVSGQFGITGIGTLPNVHTQLYEVTTPGPALIYTPIGQSTTFRAPTAANPLLAAYVNPISSMVVDGRAPGATINVVMRVWQGDSYETTVNRIDSNIISVTLGGDIPNQPPAPPGLLVGLTFIPEPSTVSLGLLGAAVLLYRRRA